MADENSESDERTQDPTPRRLEEALRRGDVVKSIEVNTWFTLAGGTLATMIFAVPMASSLQTTFRGLLARSYQIPTDGPALSWRGRYGWSGKSSASWSPPTRR